MNLQELADVTKISKDGLSKFLAPFRIKVEEINWKTLEVAEGKSVTLKMDETNFPKMFKMLKPTNIEDLKEWVGTPSRLLKSRIGAGGAVLTAFKPSVSLTPTISLNDANKISPGFILKELNSAQHQLLLDVCKNIVYGNVTAANLATPAYSAAIAHLLKKEIPIFFVPNITVKSNATLKIDSSVAAIVAGRIKVYSGGKIVTGKNSKLTIHCYNMQSGMSA